MQIRTAVPDDAEAMADLRRQVYPYLVVGAAQIRYWIAEANPAERAEHFVALHGGELVGYASAQVNLWTSEPGACSFSVCVRADRRRRGIGTALADLAHAHLKGIGARRVQAYSTEESLGFAARLGYQPTRRMHYAGVDPRVLPPQPETPDGIRLVALTDLDPRQVYEADNAASQDEPSDMPVDAMSYDDWLHDAWNAPAQDLSLGVAAMAGDVVASVTLVETDGDRAWSGFTGTIPAHRGRGLAKLVKSVALRRAASAGITAAYTSNDDENPVMLGINDWLGYRRVATHVACIRALDRTAS